MTDEERLRERMHRVAANVTAPDRSASDAIANARAWRVRRGVAQLSVAALLAVSLGATLWSLLPLARSDTTLKPGHGASDATTPPSPTLSAGSTSLPGSRPGWVTNVDDQGVSVEIPEAWTFMATIQADLLSPEPVFAIGTWTFPVGGGCAPTAALGSLPSDGALAWVVEYANPEVLDDFPPRPDHLSLGPLGGPTECVGEKTHMILFRDRGRYFQIFVVFGQDATDGTRSDLLSALDTMKIDATA